MACLHETRTPSPSLALASDGTPEQELTPTQCVLRDVLPAGPAAPAAPPEAWPRRGPPRHPDLGSEGAGPLAAEAAHLRCQAGGGFLEGLFGCLKPVWTMIGKAYAAEHKHPQEGEGARGKGGAAWVLWGWEGARGPGGCYGAGRGQRRVLWGQEGARRQGRV